MFRIIGILAVVVLVAMSVAGGAFLHAGISAQRPPMLMESIVARQLRRMAVPLLDRDRSNAISVDAFNMLEAKAHWADHCAVCHAADGSGETPIGENLYPPAPDMRETTTQWLSDGELFYIIRNGVRFTGMPGWGTGDPEEDESSWHLVHLIRALPDLSADVVAEIEALMPQSAHAMEEKRAVLDFLSGGDAAADHSGGGHGH